MKILNNQLFLADAFLRPLDIWNIDAEWSPPFRFLLPDNAQEKQIMSLRQGL